MFLVNSRSGLVTAAGPRFRRHGRTRQPAPHLPKLRGQFAEFLNHGSLARLGILYLATSVGFGYGPPTRPLEAFRDSMGSPTSPLRLGIRSQAPGARIYLYTALHPYPGTTTGRAGLPFCVPPSRARTPSAAPRPATTRSTRPHAARTMTPPPRCRADQRRQVRDYQPVALRLRLSASP